MNAITNMGPEEELVKLSEAAKILNVSTHTLARWCKSGKLRHHRLNGFLYMVPRSAISHLIRDSQVA
jgi:excisionase family DNA binding protein